MNENRRRRKNKSIIQVILFTALGILILGVASLQFATSYPNYPDSQRYLLLVDYFLGNIPITETIAPFNYRILLPLIVALIPLDPTFAFSLINLILLFPLALIMYLIPKEFGFGNFSSIGASGLCMLSYPVFAFGAVVLVEVPFMLMLAVGVLGILRNWRIEYLYIITIIGVLFKETAILIAIVYMIHKRDYKGGLGIGLGALVVHLVVRAYFQAAFGSSLWSWKFSLFNLFSGALLSVIVLSFLTVSVPLVLAVILRNDNPLLFSKVRNAFVSIAGPLSFLPVISFFFAAFSSRFVWPVYLGLLPIMAFGIQNLLFRIYDFELWTRRDDRN